MKFMMMVRSSEKNGPPPPALMQAIGQLGIDAMQAGTLVQQGGLFGSGNGGALVSVRKGRLTVTDGPFTEAKEVIGGFAIFELPSREAALEQCKKFMEIHKAHWPGWEGESEMRQIFDGPPPA